MAGIHQGFFTTSSQAKKEERKQEFISPNYTSSLNQPSSSQSEGAKSHLERTPATQEKPRKTQKLTKIREVSQYNTEREVEFNKLAIMIDDLMNKVIQLKRESKAKRIIGRQRVQNGSEDRSVRTRTSRDVIRTSGTNKKTE